MWWDAPLSIIHGEETEGVQVAMLACGGHEVVVGFGLLRGTSRKEGHFFAVWPWMPQIWQ
jgi:hypothetical protein